ncbi:spore germination protein [Paenibacillus sp. TAB 01]|uniref:spore germination protein n=1 Tax=Paenibacillus sp. TAB 01 TaxID=3368988 RepID=UPI003750C020
MNMPKAETPPLWTKQRLHQLFEMSADVMLQVNLLDNTAASEIMLIYAEGLCDTTRISDSILPGLQELYCEEGFDQLRNGHLWGVLPLVPLPADAQAQEIMDTVYLGDLLLFFSGPGLLFKLNTSTPPRRIPQESSTEISIKGPKDGFVEDITTNIALIRKRIRSNTLCYETMVLGRRTRTKTGLLYISDIINPQLVTEVRKRLNKIDVDGVYSMAQLEESLADVKYSLFPLLDFTGRSDFVVASLLAGRFVILVDGNPFALVGPAGFSLILKSPEDVHFSFQYISFARLIRLFSFWLSILLPGFWVSIVAFHQDQIPFRLMATVAVARIGLPFSAQLEMFILLVLLEIFREAGVRLPSSIGQILTVVGGLVIGDAAIRSGLVSPSVVVVGSITAVTGATLVNQGLSTVVSIVRLGMYLVCCFLGMYGFILSLILLLFYMSKLSSFGVPYFSPLSPPIFRDMLKSFMRMPWDVMRKRPSFLHSQDSSRQGEDSN